MFNAAGLGQGLRANIPPQFQQYIGSQQTLVENIDLKGDPVSALGGQVGKIYQLDLPQEMNDPTTYQATGPDVAIEPHSIENVIKALENTRN